MSRLTDLEQQLKATQEQISKLQEEIEREKSLTFEPFRGGYVVGLSSVIERDCYRDSDIVSDSFQYWQTEDQAERYLKARTLHAKLFQMAEHFNEGWEPVWLNASQSKFIIYYHPRSRTYRMQEKWTEDMFSPAFKDKETAQKVIDILNREDKR